MQHRTDPSLTARRVLVYSAGNALAKAKARKKRLDKARADLDKLQRLVGSRYHVTAEKVAGKVGVIAQQRRVTDVLRTTVTSDEDGKPVLSWDFDDDAITIQAKADGWYALITDRGPDAVGPEDILLAHKGRPQVERRHHELKGPPAVAPFLIRNNQRITALMHVLMLALLVYSLIERRVRRALEREGSPDAGMSGLYPDNRRERPTARMIFYRLGALDLATGTGSDPPQIIHVTRGVQLRLLEIKLC